MFAVVVVVVAVAAAPDHGFGKLVDWVPYDSLASEMESSGKPGMVVIHKSW